MPPLRDGLVKILSVKGRFAYLAPIYLHSCSNQRKFVPLPTLKQAVMIPPPIPG